MSEIEFRRDSDCDLHGPTDDAVTMLVVADVTDTMRCICVDCVASVAASLDLPPHALDDFIKQYASFNLGTPVTVVTTDDSD